jgi:hypothetical protein
MTTAQKTSSCPFVATSLLSVALAAAAALTPMHAVSAAQPVQTTVKLDKAELAAISAQYRQDRAACLSGQTTQELDACLYDAALTVETAKRRGFETGNVPYADNARLRCEPLRGADRNDCVARMRGEGTVSGSVAAGGIYRELVTITHDAVPATSEPAK